MNVRAVPCFNSPLPLLHTHPKVPWQVTVAGQMKLASPPPTCPSRPASPPSSAGTPASWPRAPLLPHHQQRTRTRPRTPPGRHARRPASVTSTSATRTPHLPPPRPIATNHRRRKRSDDPATSPLTTWRSEAGKEARRPKTRRLPRQTPPSNLLVRMEGTGRMEEGGVEEVVGLKKARAARRFRKSGPSTQSPSSRRQSPLPLRPRLNLNRTLNSALISHKRQPLSPPPSPKTSSAWPRPRLLPPPQPIGRRLSLQRAL